MKIRVVLLAVVVGLVSASAIAADQILTFTNLGPVQIGMTQAQAEAALNTKLRSVYPEPVNGCWFGNRTDGRDETILYMFNKTNKIVTIGVGDSVWPKREKSVPLVATERGIRIGASVADVKKAYASSSVTDRHYTDGHQIEVRSPDGRHGINFRLSETDMVVDIIAGTAEDFYIVEPCI
ncbi:MAG: hypothetical protein ACYCZX_17595 [Rhodospirillaceae bacterium]